VRVEPSEVKRAMTPRKRLGRTALWAALVTVLAAVTALTVEAVTGPTGAAPAAAPAVPRVYAAASLRKALPQIDGSPVYNFGGSSQLQLQIERGGPADVFASASPTEAQGLFRAGRCSRPVTFATNVLVMLVPNANPGNVRSVYSLRFGGRRLAIGSAGVPIGAYTRRLLARMRLSSILRTNTVSNESNVSGVVSKVALGSADAGFTYVTDGRIAADRVNSISIPRWAQPPVRYQICAVKRSGGADTAGAKAFIERVTASRGRSLLKHAGFGLPPRG
jgi:molybdate transport system substrate-binding protein